MKDKSAEKIPLKVLYLDDSPQDAEIISQLLAKAEFDISMDCAKTKKEYVSMLRSQKYDVILSDFKLPGFDAFGALQLCADICPHVPFICVSGSIGEEIAIDLIKQGAVDYVLKDRLTRLSLAVKRAIDEAKEKESRRHAEERLHLSDKIMERVNSLILIADANGWITYASPSVKTILGYEAEEILGNGWWLLTRRDSQGQEEARMQVARAASGEIAVHENPYETELRSKNGEVRWILWQDARGIDKELIGVGQDITRRKRAEADLRESEGRYRTLVTLLPDALFVNVDNRIAFVNTAFCRLLGADDPKQLIGKPVLELIHRDYHEKVHERINQTLAGQPVPLLEEKYVRLDGTPVEVEVAAAVIDWQGSKASQVIVRDISGRKRAEAALLESEEKYRAFFENSMDAILLTSPDGSIQAANPAACKMLGRTEAEIRTVGRGGLVDVNDPRLENLLAERARVGKASGELTMFRKDGSPFPVEISSALFRDKQNNAHTSMIIRDITARKLADEQLKRNEIQRRELERELVQAQKLEGLGTLASGIAHDFNNLLGIIMGHASMLQGLDVPANQKKNIDAVLRATSRGASLVRQMLTFARKTDVLIESVSLNDLVGEVIKLLRETFPKTIAVKTLLAQDLPLIEADATQVHQVMLNLCVNARDAMPNGGTLTITTRRESGEALSGRHPKATAKDYLVLGISDTGVGMDEQTQGRIFEPFFTTKEHGKGTGLGLSLVFGIMESHNGFVTFHSELGRGTTFHCCFPVPDETLELPRVEEATTGEVPGGDETILVIEDEELLRELLKEILEPKGYTVLAAEDGEKGIAAYRKHGKEIALVISDLGLPKFGGDELYRRLIKENPHVRVILSSGYIEPGMKAKILKEGIRDFIQKPYNPTDILRAIRQALEGG
ncbi:MAG TPA: PAS domain S-box protein [Candidatus Acidoferrales bacterium]|nr:PAS domain S-box protein [Candidatus Acidoferrales bacterium]